MEMASLIDPMAWVVGLRLPLLGRLLLALALGAAVGLERELSGKPAGLRTNILICVGAALLTELSIVAASGLVEHELIRADPARIAAQIVSGIGFIGAGTILVARGSVLGLTTAATLWVVAAIGMTVGLQLYVEAIGATVLVVGTLLGLGWFEEAVISERTERTLEVVLAAPDAELEPVEALMEEMGFAPRLLGHRRDEEEGTTFQFGLRGKREKVAELLEALARRSDVDAAHLQ